MHILVPWKPVVLVWGLLSAMLVRDCRRGCLFEILSRVTTNASVTKGNAS